MLCRCRWVAVTTSRGEGGSPSLPLCRHEQCASTHMAARAARGGKKSQSKSAKALSPARMERGWSKDGARISSVCPAAPRKAPELQDPSSPSLPYPQRCLPPLPSRPLSSPQAGAFNYSCPPLQTACARWAGAIGFQTDASWEAPAAFPACRLPEQGRESRSVSSSHSRGGEAWLLPCIVCKH